MPRTDQNASLKDALIRKRGRIDDLLEQVQKKADRHFDLA